jgi:CBS domain-containing protein
MRICQVGELVVVEEPQPPLMPIGVVSARDFVTRIVAPGLDPAVFTAGDIAWSGGARANVMDSLSHTLDLLEKSRAHALPVIDDDGSLAGVISLDDVLLALGKM